MENNKSLRSTEVSIQEIWAHTRPLVHKNKRAYTRKEKHRGSKDPRD